MENASKALLIAAGVLITVIILTFGVSIYTLFSNHSKEYARIMDDTEIQKFNSNFDIYIGRKDITAQEVISVCNLAKEYGDKIKINIQPNTGKMGNTPEEFLSFFSDKTFECNGTNENPKYDDTGRIIELTFKIKS